MNKYIVELLGTLFLVYVILVTKNAVAIGAALAIAIIVGSKISGGHFNPAVTIAMALAGKKPMNDVMPYILSQVVGAMCALELYRQTKN
jgi:glycerol uptake facilitator-like aquaporin|tara:strand:- start:12113 stop:12379 length:267 start_codon:yes stop_codon:yes gene_type:complete